MNLLIVAATDFEIKPFIQSITTADVLITGIGMPATIFHVTKQLTKKKYDLAIQAGIAGSFNKDIKKGDVVIVKQDTFGDIGINEKGNFYTLFDLSFIKENSFPFNEGWLINKTKFPNINLPVAKGVTVNKITDDEEEIMNLNGKFNADIETMEGAAFHYVCLQQKVKFIQLRSISNTVGERDKTKWAVKKSIANLDIELKKIIKNIK